MVASHEALKSSSAAAAPAQGSSSQQGTSAAASSTPPVTTTTHLSRGSTQPVAAILKQCLSPPSPAAVESALTLLRQIGALDSQEALTALGHHLKQMPMDPRCVTILLIGNSQGF
jgi:HrpA-like RNA helicase